MKSGYKIIYKTQFGSHIYGTNLPTSDTDFKAVVLPSADDILLQRVLESDHDSTKIDSNARNTSDDVDVEIFTLQQYLKLLMEGQTVALDMLFTPSSFHSENNETWKMIVDNKEKFFSKKCKAFVGYCRKQAGKYGIKGSRVSAVRTAIEALDKYKDPLYRLGDVIEELSDKLENEEHIGFPVEIDKRKIESKYFEVCGRKFQMGIYVSEAKSRLQKIFGEYGQRALLAEQNNGVDWKALMHAVRVCSTAVEFMQTRQITLPRPDALLLLQIRKGELPYSQVAEIIEQGVEAVEKASALSSLPNEPDYEFADNLVKEVYRNIVKGG